MLGAWNPPAFLSSLNDPAAIDTDPTISADGLELFFGSDRPGVGNLDIWHSTRTSLAATFAAPTLVAELATIGDDSAPAISGDGLTIYFRRGTDIFRATRATTTSPFTSVGLDAELSSAELDTNPVVSHNGLFASVTRETTATDRELYLYARGSTSDAWGIPRKLIELSTPLSESGAALSDDGLQLWFHSDRGTAGGGQLDVYLASRASGFAPFVAAPVTELNTAVVESDPAVTRDLRIMVFERATELMIATR